MPQLAYVQTRELYMESGRPGELEPIVGSHGLCGGCGCRARNGRSTEARYGPVLPPVERIGKKSELENIGADET